MAVTAGAPLILLCKLLKIGDGKWHHGNNDFTKAGVCNAAFQLIVHGINYKKANSKHSSQKKNVSSIVPSFDYDMLLLFIFSLQFSKCILLLLLLLGI